MPIAELGEQLRRAAPLFRFCSGAGHSVGSGSKIGSIRQSSANPRSPVPEWSLSRLAINGRDAMSGAALKGRMCDLVFDLVPYEMIKDGPDVSSA
jgi:hypothetical protein